MDERERRLIRDGVPVHIEPKSFDLLCQLLHSAGQLVSKQSLMDTVWPGVVVTDNSLTRCVHQLRAALGDHADSPQFIETVPGAGYRFVAQVNRPSAAPRSRRRRTWLTSGLAALASIGFIAWYIAQQWNGPDPSVERLAVLPLVDLTGDPEQAYFVQGVHDALISELSRLDAIDVISRTSVMRYRDTTLGVPEIAGQLDVDALVEGSVLREGDRLTVIAQLIGAVPERHLWAEQFDRGIGDVFDITRQITRSIAVALDLDDQALEQFLAKTPRPVDPEAYDAYLRGRFKFQTKTGADYEAAQAMFQRALEIDPDFAPAYTGLGHNIGSSIIFGMQRPADGMPQVKALALKALEIDESLEEALLLMAGVSFYYEWDWTAAENRIRRVLEQNPSSAPAYRMLAEVLSVTGRHEAALTAIERGRTLDPMTPVSQLKPSLILFLKRDYRKAVDWARVGTGHFPEFWVGHWLLCRAQTALGAYEEAIRSCQRAVEYSRRAQLALAALGYASARGGHAEEARQIVTELESLRGERYVDASSLAILHGVLGQREQAFAELQRALEERDTSLVHMQHAAEFDQFRAEPRFAAFWDKAQKND